MSFICPFFCWVKILSLVYLCIIWTSHNKDIFCSYDKYKVLGNFNRLDTASSLSFIFCGPINFWRNKSAQSRLKCFNLLMNKDLFAWCQDRRQLIFTGFRVCCHLYLEWHYLLICCRTQIEDQFLLREVIFSYSNCCFC